MVVKKIIFGKTVEARPKFNGGCTPDYWYAIVNNNQLPRKFSSPGELFENVSLRIDRRHTDREETS
jgi:hypothetical protein